MVESIFNCKAKPLALGLRDGYGLQREGFPLPISTCWYPKTLACPTRAPNTSQYCPTRAYITQRKPQHWPVEYNLRWTISRWLCVGHVDFTLLVSCLLALDSQRKCGFQWNMGFIIMCKGRVVALVHIEPPPPRSLLQTVHPIHQH